MTLPRLPAGLVFAMGLICVGTTFQPPAETPR